VREPGLDGEEAELVVTSTGRTLTVDGLQRVARAPAFESAGTAEAREFVVRATGPLHHAAEAISAEMRGARA
jgi:hypothetical protein